MSADSAADSARRSSEAESAWNALTFLGKEPPRTIGRLWHGRRFTAGAEVLRGKPQGAGYTHCALRASINSVGVLQANAGSIIIAEVVIGFCEKFVYIVKIVTKFDVRGAKV